MYPKQHLVTSASGTAAAALFVSGDPVTAATWAVIGGIAGVLIDVDHVLLSMAVGKNIGEGLAWFRRPVTAITAPRQLLDDIDYDTLVVHRLATHLLILGGAVALTTVHWMFAPVSVGIGIHLCCDVIYDLYDGNYRRVAERR